MIKKIIKKSIAPHYRCNGKDIAKLLNMSEKLDKEDEPKDCKEIVKTKKIKTNICTRLGTSKRFRESS